MSRRAPVSRLAVIDLQNVFADPASAWFTPGLAGILEPVRRLVGAFGERVTFTRFLAPAAPSGSWRAYYARWPFALQPPEAYDYRLVEEFEQAAPDTLDATTFGKWTPRLAELVGEDGRLVLAGVATDCCVLSTALAAADDGVEVRVVADACAGSTPQAHEDALAVMRLYEPLISVVTLSDVLA